MVRAGYERHAFRAAKRRRRGGALVAVLFTLSAVTMLIGVMYQTVLRTHSRARTARYACQTEWLVESGLQRCMQRLREESDYGGESWELNESDIVGTEPGQIDISVEADSGAPDRRTVIIVARYPLSGKFSTRHSQMFLVSLPE